MTQSSAVDAIERSFYTIAETSEIVPPLFIESVSKLGRDLKKAARSLTAREARYLVDTYYALQDYRIAAGGQIRSAEKLDEPEPHEITSWLFSQMENLEGSMKSVLLEYAKGDAVGQWALSITGIGPVIAAGLLAHIDIEKAPTVGHIWRFAGLDPTLEWAKGSKRPFNAKLKVLCAFKIGESFVKQKGRDSDQYGHLYTKFKAELQAKNDAGAFAGRAAAALSGKRWKGESVTKKAYESGRLSDGHIHADARRRMVKIFLAHYHHIAYRYRYGVDPPKPYAIEHLGHAHEIAIPNYPF